MKTLALTVLFAVASACGGSPTSSLESEHAASSTCTGSVGGAASGTIDCGDSAKAAWSTDGNKGAFFVAAGGDTASAPRMTVAIEFPGEPRVGTYRAADASVQGGLVVNAGQSAFSVSRGESGLSGGDYVLTLEKVAQTSSISEGKTYDVHGTLEATLHAVSGSGTVTLHVKF